MKRSIKITFSAMVTALISLFMAVSIIPNITFAVPAVAGLFIIPVFLELGTAWSFSVFGASALLSFVACNKTSWILYLCLFGYYPIVKPLIEKIKKPITEWALKLALFNFAAVVCYLFELLVFGITVKIWLLLLAFVLGNAAFVLYDMAVSQTAAFYYGRLHSKVSELLKW